MSMTESETVVLELAPEDTEPATDMAAPAAEEVQSRPLPVSVFHPLETILLRTMDVAVGAAVLVVTSPLILTLVIILKLDSPGPAFFRQKRIGRGERPFTFIKFRTMYVDARERYSELYTYSYTPEEIRVLYFKTKEDPRLTRFGRWLRRTSMDELPNFINVVLGQMSLVGPRPEIPELLPYYTKEQRLKFTVKPGVTGPAQINGRGLLSLQDTIGMDCRYVDERSISHDLKVLIGTVVAIVRGPGAF